MRRWCATVGIMMLFTAVVAVAMDPLYPVFHLFDKTRIHGVYVRDLPELRSIVVVTAEKPLIIKRNEIRVAGSMVRLAAEASTLLNIVDDNIKADEFNRARQNVRELQAVVRKFEIAVQPYLNTHLEENRAKAAALHNAIAYYRKEIAVVPKAIAVLELQVQVVSLESHLINENSAYSRATLRTLIGFREALTAIKGETRIVKKERAEIAAMLAREQTRNIKALHDRAIEQIAATASRYKAETYLNAIGVGDGIDDLYHQDLAVFMENVYAILEKRLSAVMPSAEAVLSLSAQFDETQRAYAEATRLARDLHSLLTFANGKLFGPDEAALRVRLQAQIDRTNETLRSAAVRRGEISTTRRILRNGHGALAKQEYGAAIKAYERVVAMTDHPELRESALGGILSAKESVINARLEKVKSTTVAENRATLAAARAFLKENGGELGDYRKVLTNITKLNGYVDFQEQFAAVQSSPDSIEKWDGYIKLNRWLDKNRVDVHPNAFEEWKDYVDSMHTKMFEKASAQYTGDSRYVLAGKRDTLGSLVEYCLLHDHHGAADMILDFGLSNLSTEASKPLVGLHMQLAQAFAVQGQDEKAFGIYNRLMDKHEDLRSDRALQRQIATLQLRLADETAAAGKIDQAIERLARLAAETPVGIVKSKVLKQLVQMQVQKFSNDIDPDERLLKYDELCKEYGAIMSKEPKIQKVRSDLVDVFATQWQSGAFIDAIITIQEFEAAYPNFASTLDIRTAIVPSVRRTVRDFDRDKQTGQQVATAFINGLQLFVQRFPEVSEDSNFDSILVSWKVAVAKSYEDAGRVLKADEIYRALLINYKLVAKDYALEDRRESLRRRVILRRIQDPMGIRGDLDWVIFGLAVMFWLYTYINAHRGGQARGHTGYRLLQFATVFSAFLVILLPAVLYAHYSFTTAFIWAIFIPSVLFYTIGFGTYLFFPLIYGERRLVLERALLKALGGQRDAMLTNRRSLKSCLSANIARLQKDLPLLHDRLLYRISKAKELAETQPDKGYHEFENLLRRLDKELVKTTEDWKNNYAECLFVLGKLAAELGRTEDAHRYLDRRLWLDPKHIETRVLLGDLLFDTGDFEGAISHVKVCLAARGGTAELWSKLGRCFFETGKYVAAYKCYDSITEKTRDSLFWGARSHARADEMGKAVALFQQLLEQEPEDSEAMYYLASSLAAHGSMDKAVKISGLVKEGDIFYSRILAMLGNIRFLANDIKDAKVKFKQALSMDANCLPAFVGMGQLYFEGGKLDKAATIFDQVLQTEPDNIGANYYRGLLYESSDVVKATRHLESAARSESFGFLAHIALGRIHVVQGRYESALQHYDAIESLHEMTCWGLFFYAYALAYMGRQERCAEVVNRILEQASVDSAWTAISQKALYSMGLFFVDHRAFAMARLCFKYVVANVTEPRQQQHLNLLIAESGLRHAVSLAAAGDYEEAQAVLIDLQSHSTDSQQHLLCQHYVSLCQLHQGRYDEARANFTELAENAPGDARYLYHAIVAEVGLGNDQAVQSGLQKLQTLPGLPPHLRAGISTIEAYICAREGKHKEALSLLERAGVGDGYTGAESVERTLTLGRIFYICHLREFARIEELLKGLPKRYRVDAAYLQAVGLIVNGQADEARHVLSPYAKDTEQASRLFSILSTELAIDAVAQRDQTRARMIFEEIPAPPPEITTVILALSLSEVLDNADEATGIRHAIRALSVRLEMSDKYFVHSVIHNIAVLHFQLATVLEESNATDEIFDAWNDCLTFWEENVFIKTEFWNLEAKRFANPGGAGHQFAETEITAINRQFKLEAFVKMFIYYVIAKLDACDEEGCERYLALLSAAGDNARESFAMLGRELEIHKSQIARDDSRTENWTFVIISLLIQIRVGQAEGRDVEMFTCELQSLRDAQPNYETVSEFQKAKRKFTTSMLDVLQRGAMGEFASAGDALDKLLRNKPAGIDLHALEGSLRLLRETARDPDRAAEQGKKLNAEFDKMYSAIRNFNIKRAAGEDDKSSKKLKSVKQKSPLSI